MQDLTRLLKPKTLAVIGGGVWCKSVIEQCQKIGFSGEIWPVHPRKDTVAGLKAFASIEALPDTVDAAFIGVNRHATVEAVRALSARNCGGAVCFASGFLEAENEAGDGRDLQNELLSSAGEMPIIGPNCYGFINYLDRAVLWPDQHGGIAVDRGVALITQSSNLAINLTMQKRGLPLSYVATAGNQAQLGIADLGRAFLEDPRVTALGLHIEGIGDIPALEELAREAKAKQQGIVAIKVGQSEQAQAATISHTASIAGSDSGARGVLKRLGIAQVDRLNDLLEALMLLHSVGPLKGSKVVSMSCSGGEASLIADMALAHALEFPALSAEQSHDLRQALGPMVALANPLDYHTYIWGDAEAMGKTFSAMLKGNVDIGCIIADFPRSDRCAPEAWDCVIQAAAYAHELRGIPLAIVSSIPENCDEALSGELMRKGLIPLHGLENALSAIEAAAFIGTSLTEHPKPIVLGHPPHSTETLEEAEAKDVLASYGLVTPKRAQVVSTEALDGALEGFTYPLVLKGQGAAHKSEAGLVALDLKDQEAVKKVAQEMASEGFLVEEMVTGTLCELLVGILRDPVHGFVLTIGAGGVMTELLRDTASLMLPIGEREIIEALESLKIAPLLQGFRGKPPANMPSVINAVLRVQDYVLAHLDEIEEVEINPLIVTPERAVAVDALIRKGQSNVGHAD